MIAVLLAVLCHGVVFFLMSHYEIQIGSLIGDEEIQTSPVVVRNTEDQVYVDTPLPIDKMTVEAKPLEPLNELEIIDKLPENLEIDISPDIEEPQIPIDTQLAAAEGTADATAPEITFGSEVDTPLEDLGATKDFLKPAAGRIIVDAGIQNADRLDPDRFNQELMEGVGGAVKDGLLKDYTSLREMLTLPGNDLVNKTGMIGSDLLYEFNSAVLRDGARISLTNVALLIDKNPDLVCWIEGHTDLIGSKEANIKLSIARAQAVKNWLVASQKIDPKILFVRGFGKSMPKITEGGKKEQAINRRVEIKMRRAAPAKFADGGQGLDGAAAAPSSAQQPSPESGLTRKPRIITPKRNPNLPAVQQDAAPSSAADLPVKPPKAVIVEETEASTPSVPESEQPSEPQRVIPKAIPLEEPQQIGEPPSDGEQAPRAIPVE